jgi:hypothetical protein
LEKTEAPAKTDIKETKEMSTLSLSIFTIEADLKPLLAFATKKHEEADAFFRDERVRTKLKSVSSGGIALCDDYSILRLRLANADERARYRDETTSSIEGHAAVFLVDVDKE